MGLFAEKITLLPKKGVKNVLVHDDKKGVKKRAALCGKIILNSRLSRERCSKKKKKKKKKKKNNTQPPRAPTRNEDNARATKTRTTTTTTTTTPRARFGVGVLSLR